MLVSKDKDAMTSMRSKETQLNCSQADVYSCHHWGFLETMRRLIVRKIMVIVEYIVDFFLFYILLSA